MGALLELAADELAAAEDTAVLDAATDDSEDTAITEEESPVADETAEEASEETFPEPPPLCHTSTSPMKSQFLDASTSNFTYRPETGVVALNVFV